jgi:hypothetical protein
MLLPTKGISADRALLTVGADILDALRTPTSISGLWERYGSRDVSSSERVTFDWFSLALASLYSMGVLEMTANGYLKRVSHVPS